MPARRGRASLGSELALRACTGRRSRIGGRARPSKRARECRTVHSGFGASPSGMTGCTTRSALGTRQRKTPRERTTDSSSRKACPEGCTLVATAADRRECVLQLSRWRRSRPRDLATVHPVATVLASRSSQYCSCSFSESRLDLCGRRLDDHALSLCIERNI